MIVSKYWWETSPVVGYVRSWKKQVAVVGNDIWRMILQSSKLLLFYDFNRFIPALYRQSFVFLVEATTISKYGRCFLFWGLGANFNTFLFFSHLFRVISPDNLLPYQGILFLLCDFLRHAVCDVNPVNVFPRQSVTIKGELVPIELFSQTSNFIVTASL